MTSSNLHHHRNALGLTQSELGARAGLSRQSIAAIESGRSTPSVDTALALARALRCSVEALFGQKRPVDAPLQVELAGPLISARLCLVHVRDRWVGLPLSGADARIAADALAFMPATEPAMVTPLVPLDVAQRSLAIAGCATGLGVLVDRVRCTHEGVTARWLPSSNGRALRALQAGHVHIAGVHHATTERSLGAAGRAGRADSDVAAVTLARWQAGLLSRPDDGRVRGAADLIDPSLRLVLREPESGAQTLMTKQLALAGVATATDARGGVVASGHLEVGQAVALGAADVGIASYDAAKAFDLRFSPLVEERFDLLIPRPMLNDPRVERLLDVLCSLAMRRELASLGYDSAETGARVEAP